MTPISNIAPGPDKLLSDMSEGIGGVVDELRARGAETWRNLASRLLVRLSCEPGATLAPLCRAAAHDAEGNTVVNAQTFLELVDLMRGIAAAILVGGQPITILGVRFEDPSAKGGAGPQERA